MLSQLKRFLTKLLDRYLLKEVSTLFVFGVVGFIIIGLVDVLFTLVDLFINSGVPLTVVIKLLLYKIPLVIVYWLPMVVLFATMAVMIRMARSSEVTVLRAGGISLLRITMPVIMFGVIISLCSFVLNEQIVPWSNHVSDNLLRKVVLKKPPPEITENVFFRESRNRYFYIRNIDTRHQRLEDIFIYELTGNYPRVITAQRATWDANQWTLFAGVIHRYDTKGFIQYESGFEKMIVNAEADISAFYSDQKTPREMSSKELSKKIRDLEQGGIDVHSLKSEYYMKYSLPVSCLVFALIATSLCLFVIKTHRDFWEEIIVIMSAVLLVGFFLTLTAICRALGRGGVLAPWLAAWGPNIIYLTIGSVLSLWQSMRK